MSRVLAAAGLVMACLGIASIPNLVQSPRTFLVLFAAAFGCYLIGVRAFMNAPDRGTLAMVLGVAAAARLVLLPAPPSLSTDAYRYVWDARVAAAGIDPYAHAPNAREVEPLRDGAIHPRLNHPTWRTIYPPGAQLVFRAIYRLRPDSVMAMKAAVCAAELLALAGVLGLLATLGVPAARIVIYAWNPLVLIEVWGSAHLDALVVAAVVGAAWAAVAGRRVLAAALLGVGTLVKLYPALLVPLLLAREPAQQRSGQRPGSWTPLAVFAAIVAAGYAPMAGLGLDALGSLSQYMTQEYFNPGARSIVDVPALPVLALAAWVAWVVSRPLPIARRAVLVIGAAVLLSPNIFPWYVLWMMPFLAVVPSLPWIAFSGSVALAYTFFFHEPWAIPAWARVLEFAPLAMGGAWWLARGTGMPSLAMPIGSPLVRHSGEQKTARSP